jgi:hypothetical protein
VLCNSSDGVLVDTVPEILELTLNGQQFGSVSLSFTPHAPPAVVALSPSSGPTGGRTAVTVSLSARETPANHTCRFGYLSDADGGAFYGTSVVVAAAFDAAVDGAAAVRCATPPAASAGTNHTSLEYSLNAQQYAPAAAGGFTYYTPVVLAAASPSSGPVHGGTNVTLTGDGLWGDGSHPLCRFGAATVPASRAGNFDGEQQLRCIAPANATAPAGGGHGGHGGLVVSLHVTLNGQQFSAELPGGFTHYAAAAEIAEMAELAQLSPDLGPSAGGTLIVLSGGGVGGAGSDRRCRFSGGDAEVVLPATAGAVPGTLLCESPPELAALGSHAPPDGTAADGAVQWVRLATPTPNPTPYPYPYPYPLPLPLPLPLTPRPHPGATAHASYGTTYLGTTYYRCASRLGSTRSSSPTARASAPTQRTASPSSSRVLATILAARASTCASRSLPPTVRARWPRTAWRAASVPLTKRAMSRPPPCAPNPGPDSQQHSQA